MLGETAAVAHPRRVGSRICKPAGVPCGSVRDVAEVLQDPHLDARGMIQEVEHAAAGAVRVTGVPIKLSDTPGAVRTAPPTLGQHTDADPGDRCRCRRLRVTRRAKSSV